MHTLITHLIYVASIVLLAQWGKHLWRAKLADTALVKSERTRLRKSIALLAGVAVAVVTCYLQPGTDAWRQVQDGCFHLLLASGIYDWLVKPFTRPTAV